MAKRTVYEGGIAVAGSDYTHPAENGNDEQDEYVEVPIEGLDEPVTGKTRLAFTLDYPFDQPFEGAVHGEGGVTLRQIIDAIRGGYRKMYEGARHQPIPNLANQLVDGDYGRAYHAIGDLVIEAIELDEGEGTLDVFVGS
jgi:hypothetical protein